MTYAHSWKPSDKKYFERNEIKMNIDPREINEPNNKEFDYKKLYEEAKAKLDKIEYEMLKSEIDKKLGLTRHLKDVYNNREPLDYLKNKKVYSFLRTLYSEDAIDLVINDIGWGKLTKIIDDVYKEVLAEEAKKAEEKK